MLYFTGKDWQLDESESYKKRLADEIGNFLTRPLIIGSLTTFLEGNYKAAAGVSSDRAWFLLLDLHRFLIYDDDFSDKHARIEDIAYFLNDITTEKHLKLLKLYESKSPVCPANFERVLAILPFFLQANRPGWSVTFNTITGEIISARASKHPLNESIYPERSKLIEENLKIESRAVGSDGRGLEFPRLEESVSPEANIIRFSDVRSNALSIPVGRSLVAWRQGEDKFICGGKHTVPDRAELISLFESLERFQVMYHSPASKLIRASYAELNEKSINPDELFYSSRNQTFDPETPIYWTEAFEVLTGDSTLVPAQEIWFDTANLDGEKLWITNTTNGCAVGGNFEEAVLFGILEAIERDSFLTCWYLKKPCKRIEAENLKNEQLHLLLSKIEYLKPQYEIIFLDLRNDLNIPVVLAMSVRKYGTGPKFFLAVASGLNYASAAFSALKDIQNLLSFPPTPEENSLFQRLQKNQTQILQPEEHQGIYTLDEMFEKVSFFDSGEICPSETLALYELTDEREEAYDIKSLIEKLNTACRQVGVSLFYKNITHQSLSEKGFQCVKIIGKGLFPMWYGYYNIRAGLTQRLKKISLEEKQEKISDLSELNLEIHPFG
jgi:thiazole/oxazole-forming peptide maturase SagD family component